MNTNFTNGDFVMLLERHNMTRSSNDDYVFEGICAKFGITNENMRVYDKNDYLPHLDYLNTKIAKKSLLGELDHPKDYEVSLQNASHIVEKLWYEESDDSVRIRIRLLNGTPNGELAKSLVDMGVPLAISSRAVGQIKESKQVKLHRIFTYDLVAEPGFAEAVLDRSMNESFSPMVKINEQYDVLKEESLFNSKLQDVNEELNFKDGVKIYKINDSDEVLNKYKINETSENNETTMADNYVNSKDFNDFSEVTKGEISGIKEMLGKIQDSLVNIKKVNEETQEEEIQDLQAQETQTQEEAQEFETQTQTQETETTELENITPEDDDKAIIGKLTNYVNYLSDQVKVIMDHADIMTENLNKVINYSQNIGLAVNEHINHTNGAFQTVNDAINYMNYIGKAVNRVDETQEKLIKYSNEHTQVINEMILFSDYNSNLIGNIVEHTNYLANVLRGSSLADGKAENVSERDVTAPVETITEAKSCDTKEEKKDKKEEKVDETVTAEADTVTEKVDTLIAAIEKDRVSNVLESRYPFLKLLNENDKKLFYAADPTLKKKIVATLEASAYFNRDDVISVMNAVVNEELAELPNYVKFMPTKFNAVYESMTDLQKKQLQRLAESGVYKLNTPYQVKFFWESQDFSGVKTQIDNEKLVENKASEATKDLNESQSKEGFIQVSKLNEQKRGYSDAYLESIRNMGRR